MKWHCGNTSKQEVKTPLPSPTGSLSKAISTGGIVAANMEVQCVMDSNSDGTLLIRTFRR